MKKGRKIAQVVLMTVSLVAVITPLVASGVIVSW